MGNSDSDTIPTLYHQYMTDQKNKRNSTGKIKRVFIDQCFDSSYARSEKNI
jgi:hypothetical protein